VSDGTSSVPDGAVVRAAAAAAACSGLPATRNAATAPTRATRTIQSSRFPLVPIPGGGGAGVGDGAGDSVGAGVGLATVTAVTSTWTPAFGLPFVMTGTPPAFRHV